MTVTLELGFVGATSDLLWDKSITDTYTPHFKTYNKRAELDAAYEASPARHWRVAYRWVEQLQRQQ